MNIKELEQQEALNTFDLPKGDIFNLMWAPFYHENLRDGGLISPAALKGFCRMVVDVMKKEGK